MNVAFLVIFSYYQQQSIRLRLNLSNENHFINSKETIPFISVIVGRKFDRERSDYFYLVVYETVIWYSYCFLGWVLSKENVLCLFIPVIPIRCYFSDAFGIKMLVWKLEFQVLLSRSSGIYLFYLFSLYFKLMKQIRV